MDCIDPANRGCYKKRMAHPQETLSQHPILKRYADMLKRAGRAHNLIALQDLDDETRLWDRHILNAALLDSFVKPFKHIVDVGSGAGLPGMVLGILNPNVHIHFVEPRLKRAVFLAETARALGVKATLHQKRIEECPLFTQDPEEVCFVSRAFKPLPDALKALQKHLEKGSPYFCLKGAQFKDEVRKAETRFSFDLEVFGPLTHADSWVLSLKNVRSNL